MEFHNGSLGWVDAFGEILILGKNQVDLLFLGGLLMNHCSPYPEVSGSCYLYIIVRLICQILE